MNEVDVRALLEQHIAAGGFGGAAVIAWRGGDVVVEHYAGMAGPGLDAGPTVLWPIASISKAYAAATVMRLVELGAITLSTKLADIIPEFGTAGVRGEVRLRHLLTHSSGLPYEPPDMEDRLAAQQPLHLIVDAAAGSALRFDPGSSVAYADNNTLLAGEMAARVIGRPFHELVTELIIEPMGLSDTFFPAPAEHDHRIATVANVMAAGTEGAMYNSRYGRALPHPAFAVVASARDLARFWSHFAPSGPRVHTDATVRAMTTNQSGLTQFDPQPGVSVYELAGRKPWGYGPSLQTQATPGVFAEMAGFRSFGHGGASGCIAFVDPDEDLVVAVLSNNHLNSGYDAWHRRLLSILNVAFVQAVTTTR